MKNWKALLACTLAASLLSGCSKDETERWVTTDNTTVKIDWDKVNEAYRNAEGPKDFEQKVNEIYEGDEVISIAVEDTADKNQVVTGFFDKNSNGAVEEPEKIFSIQRSITEGKGQYQVVGHGAYGYYRSPFWDIASGMLLGAMISSAFRPNYAPVSYTTSAARSSQLRSYRNSYRAKNPSRFARSKKSSSGRTYGSSNRGTTTRSSSSRRSSGGGFGIRGRRRREKKPVRLVA
ncbi:MAG: hypothetical protein MJE77_15415 [Proteobacteria bacterium]|nr:hypothetical protein [Pseudomonadota bacterium]